MCGKSTYTDPNMAGFMIDLEPKKILHWPLGFGDHPDCPDEAHVCTNPEFVAMSEPATITRIGMSDGKPI